MKTELRRFLGSALLLFAAGALSACEDGAGAIEKRYANGQLWSSIHIAGGVGNGPWVTWYENGQMESRGDYRDGMRWGLWERWFENGKPYMRGSYEAGIEQGDWEIFYPDGSPRASGSYHQGALTGTWKLWSDQGVLITSAEHLDPRDGDPGEIPLEEGEARRLHGFFALGQRHGTSLTFYESGICSDVEGYRFDRLHGPSASWWPNGKPRSEGSYANGKRVGHWRYWLESGKLAKKLSGVFENDELISPLDASALAQPLPVPPQAP